MTQVINIYITVNLLSTVAWKVPLALLNDAAKCQIHKFGKLLSIFCYKWILINITVLINATVLINSTTTGNHCNGFHETSMDAKRKKKLFIFCVTAMNKKRKKTGFPLMKRSAAKSYIQLVAICFRPILTPVMWWDRKRFGNLTGTSRESMAKKHRNVC